MDKIRLLIADSRLMFQYGLQKALEKIGDIKVVASCVSGKDAINTALKLKPNIILLDAYITECNCVEVYQQVKQLLPDVRIIIVNQREIENKDPMLLLKLNSDGYISEDIDPLHLISIIHDISSGMRAISPYMGLKILKAYEAMNKKDKFISQTRLTRREIEVLSLVVQGFTNREISERLFLSINTVKAHLTDIMKKMGAPNRQRVALLAIEKGLLNEEKPDDVKMIS